MAIQYMSLVLPQDKKERGIKTIPIKFEYLAADFARHEQIAKYASNAIVQYLVMWDGEKPIVSDSAPSWYKTAAALHEIICCGGQFHDYAGITPEDPKAIVCRKAEEFVISQFAVKEVQRKYIQARKQMFEFLVRELEVPNEADFLSNYIMLKIRLGLI